MNRKEPQPLSMGIEGKNFSITHIQKGLNTNLSKMQKIIVRPSPPPAPPDPPVSPVNKQ